MITLLQKTYTTFLGALHLSKGVKSISISPFKWWFVLIHFFFSSQCIDAWIAWMEKRSPLAQLIAVLDGQQNTPLLTLSNMNLTPARWDVILQSSGLMRFIEASGM